MYSNGKKDIGTTERAKQFPMTVKSWPQWNIIFKEPTQ